MNSKKTGDRDTKVEKQTGEKAAGDKKTADEPAGVPLSGQNEDGPKEPGTEAAPGAKPPADKKSAAAPKGEKSDAGGAGKGAGSKASAAGSASASASSTRAPAASDPVSEPDDPYTPPATAIPAPQGQGSTLGMGAMAVAIVGSLAAATISSWGPPLIGYPAPPEGGDELAELEIQVSDLAGRIDMLDRESLPPLEERLGRLEDIAGQPPEGLQALDERVASLETRPEGVDSPAELTAQVTGLSDRVAGLEGGIANIEGRVSALQETVQGFESRLGETASAVSALDSDMQNNASLVLAVDAVRAALQEGRSFGDTLPGLRPLADGDTQLGSAISVLEANADGSLVTRNALIDRFPATADAVRDAAARPEDGNVVSRTLSRVTSLVQVRPSEAPEGGAEAGDTPAILAAAQANLDRGDLAGAVAELEKLQGPEAEAAAPWMADARRRMEVGRALEQLRQAALTRLGQGAG